MPVTKSVRASAPVGLLPIISTIHDPVDCAYRDGMDWAPGLVRREFSPLAQVSVVHSRPPSPRATETLT